MDQKKRASAIEMLMIGLKLLIVCAVVAAVVSGVNAMTDERYRENIREQKRMAIAEIYAGETILYKELSSNGSEVVYEVTAGDSLVGYCVEVVTSGFGGDITMMVGFGADGRVKGVSIVSMSETPGLGSKAGEAAFLSQYKDQAGMLTLGEDVDAITGATISSRAVTDGVNKAVAALERQLSGGVANE